MHAYGSLHDRRYRLPRVLAVEDDPQIGALLTRYLEGQGMCVHVARTAAQVRAVMLASQFDVVLLDLGLPDEDGLALLRELQTTWGGPVIIVSGRTDAIEKVVGLELGADDYVGKPFDLRELLARIRSVLRRSAGTADRARNTGAVSFDGLVLDPDSRQLTGRHGEEVPLTGAEFQLLQVLLEHPGQILSRDRLMNAMHGRDTGPFDRAIDVQIGRLRRKIELDPSKPRLVKSVRGAGYLFAAAVHRD